MATTILVIGGTGFLGKNVVSLLQQHNYQVFTFSRSHDSKNHIKGSILDTQQIVTTIEKTQSEVVINLVGLSPLYKTKNKAYQQIHVVGVDNIIKAVNKTKNVKKIIHISALGADEKSEITYLKTKGQGEKALLNSQLPVTIFAPSLIFDKENELFSLLDKLKVLKIVPFPSLQNKTQPIFVKDVARYILLATKGEIQEPLLEIGGPEILTTYEIAQLYLRQQKVKTIPLPLSIAHYLFGLGKILGPLSQDFSKLIEKTNIVESTSPMYIHDLQNLRNWIQKLD